MRVTRVGAVLGIALGAALGVEAAPKEEPKQRKHKNKSQNRNKHRNAPQRICRSVLSGNVLGSRAAVRDRAAGRLYAAYLL